ncbi:hypothetical protein FQR65_LT14312 [Abscondita terminalis]|nr:hypothetical protein FQR65_LT14312 [Abscondita terminalis]
MNSQISCRLKRKGIQKTSEYQYEMYLLMMETDPVIRTGIINPTIGDDYIVKAWEKLNASDKGPVLCEQEWRKRFNDWKNSVRSKYRKIVESGKRTGGGPKLEVKLSPLEERGLVVWGKVAVTGSLLVPVTGGLQLHEEDFPEKVDVIAIEAVEPYQSSTACEGGESFQFDFIEPALDEQSDVPPQISTHFLLSIRI